MVTFLFFYFLVFSNKSSNATYVGANSGKSEYTFVIPMVGCGTRSFDTQDGESSGFENMVMMQNEEMVQEMWDIARKITCDWTNRMEKLITFRPFAVDMLQAEEVRYSGDDVMCWMDIQLGKGPFADPVDGIVKIGDEMTIVVYTKDGGADYDMLVKNCYAYDSQDLESANKLQLSDEQGCLLKPKLMNYFLRTGNTGNTGADLIAYATIFAFKFPDKMDVFLSCEVELCKGGCDNTCDGAPSKIVERFETTTTTTIRPPVVDICVTNPGLPQCCAKNPNNPACPDPCLRNPGTPQCCAKNPRNRACTTTSTTTTTRRTTTRRTTTPRTTRRTTTPRTTTRRTTTPRTPRPDPCVLNPGSVLCCFRMPTNPSCTTTTSTTTTIRPDPCDLNPLLPQCCRQNPNLPQCTTTVPTTTSIFDPCTRNPGASICCARNPDHSACTTTTSTTTTTPRTTTFTDPCTLNPGTPSCCARNPFNPACTTTTTSTTPRPDPCVRNPGSTQCCFRKPDHPSCPTEKPCEGSNDPRPQCKPTTTPATTPRDLSNHAFHRGQKPTGRRRRPNYGSRLTPNVLNDLTTGERRRRDVSYVVPPPPPPPRTIAMTKNFRVVGANDLTFRAASPPVQIYQPINSICVPSSTFYVGLLLLSLMLIVAVLVATFTCLRLRSVQLSKEAVEAKNPFYKQ